MIDILDYAPLILLIATSILLLIALFEYFSSSSRTFTCVIEIDEEDCDYKDNVNNMSNPTPTSPEAVFAMHHWKAEYAVSQLSAQRFYECLSITDKIRCSQAIEDIKIALEQQK